MAFAAAKQSSQFFPRLAAWPEETTPEGEAVRRPCGPEEDGVVRASHWRGRLEEAIEEEDPGSGDESRRLLQLLPAAVESGCHGVWLPWSLVWLSVRSVATGHRTRRIACSRLQEQAMESGCHGVWLPVA